MKFALAPYTAGMLLRVTFDEGIEGYADLRVWEALGDPSLEETVASLEKAPNALAQAALCCARFDGEARAECRSLFDGLIVPESHFFYREGDDLEEIERRGFTSLKVKVAPGDSLESFSKTSLSLRLDANNRFTKEEFWKWYTAQNISNVEFIEDPYRADESWESSAVPFAADRQQSAFGALQIVKPALTGTDSPYTKPLVVTNYLGHRLGEYFAAYVAGRFLAEGKTVLPSGLVHRGETPVFTPPGGTGLGLNEELQSLRWESI